MNKAHDNVVSVSALDAECAGVLVLEAEHAAAAMDAKLETLSRGVELLRVVRGVGYSAGVRAGWDPDTFDGMPEPARPLESAAEMVIGATAILVKVTGKLEETAERVLDSRASVAGQLPEIVYADEACTLLGIDGANPVKALQKRIQRGKYAHGWGLVKDGGKLIQFHRDTLRARLAKEGNR